jgi:hypothetical protein
MTSKPLWMDWRGRLRATWKIRLVALLIVLAFAFTLAAVDGLLR